MPTPALLAAVTLSSSPTVPVFATYGSVVSRSHVVMMIVTTVATVRAVTTVTTVTTGPFAKWSLAIALAQGRHGYGVVHIYT